MRYVWTPNRKISLTNGTWTKNTNGENFLTQNWLEKRPNCILTVLLQVFKLELWSKVAKWANSKKGHFIQTVQPLFATTAVSEHTSQSLLCWNTDNICNMITNCKEIFNQIYITTSQPRNLAQFILSFIASLLEQPILIHDEFVSTKFMTLRFLNRKSN